jgi:hypothetical protein
VTILQVGLPRFHSIRGRNLDRLWIPSSLLSYEYREALSPGVKRPWSDAVHLPHLVLRWRISEVIPLISHTSSWCGNWLSTGYIFMTWYLGKHRDKFTFTLYTVTTQKTTRFVNVILFATVDPKYLYCASSSKLALAIYMLHGPAFRWRHVLYTAQFRMCSLIDQHL